MSFSINTNITSLNAQNYLRTTSDFQAKTISRVTSGLRIVSSGDDAAGLSVANSFRSDEAVLSQGVRNANDGLSTLQTIDGGMSNISQLLDRARTLATQSASGTFNGDRGVLNSEFQNVISEINRQAQSVGLDTGGQFAKNLSVFVGGGRANGASTAITNGSVGIDLSKSTVDARGLGLSGVQALGVAGTDIGNGSSTSTVAQVVADSTNKTSQVLAGYTDFFFRGPGFGDNNAVKVSVNLSSVSDTGTLVSALNAAIENAGNGNSAASTAFKNAGITASTSVDATGKTQLAFSSSNAAFQVAAGDRTANALLGNLTGTTGADTTQTVSGSGATASATFGASAGNIIFRFTGSSLKSPVDLTLAVTGGSTTTDQAIASLTSQIAGNAALQAAGITTGANFLAGQTLSFTSKRGEQINVEAVGDTTNQLKFGTWMRSSTNFDYKSITAGATTAAGASTLEFSLSGGTKFSLSATATGAGVQADADALNTQFATNASAVAAGLNATVSGGNVTISSLNNTTFRLNEIAGAGNFGFNSVAGSAASTATFSSSPSATSGTFDAGGAGQTATLAFAAITAGGEQQTITVSANDPSGATKSVAVNLQDVWTGSGTSTRTGGTIDETLNAINTQLQQSNNATLQSIVAVKDNVAGTEKIKFMSTLTSFQVGVGNTNSGNGVGSQGTVASATQAAGGSTADVASLSTAQTAVSTLSNAVATLGRAQASVGKGQNQLTYSVNLAQSQLSNMAAAESRIRDADLAAEAANMTKAQIMLQAGVAALAQANSAPQQILTLLH